MSNKMYSLMLMEEVIKEIDRLAYDKRTNRSQLINEILAEKIGYQTENALLKNYKDMVLRQMDGRSAWQRTSHDTEQNVQVRTFLPYKYNPSIVYRLDFEMVDNRRMTVIRLFSRSSASLFIENLNNFFLKINQAELAYLKKMGVYKYINVSDEKNELYFVRYLPTDWMDEKNHKKDAEKIFAYLAAIDETLKRYFDELFEEEVLKELVERVMLSIW